MREELLCLMSALKSSVTPQTETRALELKEKQPRNKNPPLQQHPKHNPTGSQASKECHPCSLGLQDPF